MTENEAKFEELKDAVCRLVCIAEDAICREGFEELDNAGVEIITCLDELEQYRAIGTIDECRTAVERMKPKYPNKIHSALYDDIMRYYCPNCGRYFGERGVHNVIMFKKELYCQGEDCGQKINWSE